MKKTAIIAVIVFALIVVGSIVLLIRMKTDPIAPAPAAPQSARQGTDPAAPGSEDTAETADTADVAGEAEPAEEAETEPATDPAAVETPTPEDRAGLYEGPAQDENGDEEAVADPIEIIEEAEVELEEGEASGGF